MSICRACHKTLDSDESDLHSVCAHNFWRGQIIDQLDFASTEILELARKNVIERVAVAGVQPKLSIGFTESAEASHRLTIVGALQGSYILKPPFDAYPGMPELEALTMCMARACGLRTVPFTLIPMRDRKLAYLTRRIDRTQEGRKLAMEDMCQLTGRLTEHKYRGSHEQISKAIGRFSYNPLLDIVKFFEQVIVAFLTGNSDMHLKNFSMIEAVEGQFTLSPAYDMLSTKLMLPNDREELALTLNGKKSRLTKTDFDASMRASGIPAKAIDNLYARIQNGISEWPLLISNSFIGSGLQSAYHDLISERANRLGLTW